MSALALADALRVGLGRLAPLGALLRVRGALLVALGRVAPLGALLRALGVLLRALGALLNARGALLLAALARLVPITTLTAEYRRFPFHHSRFRTTLGNHPLAPRTLHSAQGPTPRSRSKSLGCVEGSDFGGDLLVSVRGALLLAALARLAPLGALLRARGDLLRALDALLAALARLAPLGALLRARGDLLRALDALLAALARLAPLGALLRARGAHLLAARARLALLDVTLLALAALLVAIGVRVSCAGQVGTSK